MTTQMNNDWATRATRQTAENFGKTIEKGAENIWGAQELIPDAENVREINVRLFEMARVNSDAAFAFACDMAAAKNPKDFIETWTTHATKQFDMLMEQAGELTSLGQWFVKRNGGIGIGP
jgi:hypothetical protein